MAPGAEKTTKSKLRQVVTLAGLILGLLVLSQQFSVLVVSDLILYDDFPEYWSAGRVNLSRGNPYSPDELLPLQLAVGRVENAPVMMWNPPWMLALAMPLALFPYAQSRFIWFLIHLAIVFAGVTWGWTLYGGDPKRRWVAWAVAFSFAPLLHGIKAGQTAPLIWLGVIGFLYFIRRGNDWAAGAMAAFIAIKPHILYLFALALVFWALDRRRWAVLGGGRAGFVGGARRGLGGQSSGDLPISLCGQPLSAGAVGDGYPGDGDPAVVGPGIF